MHTGRSAPRAARIATWIAVAGVAALTVAWVVAVEAVVAAAWLHPIGWALALAPAGLFAVCTWTPPGAKRPRARWVAAGALLLAVLVVLVPWNGRKQFVHDVFSVRVGMSVDAVEAVMGGYIKGVGPQWQVLEEAEPLVRGEDEGAAPPVGHAEQASPNYREPEYPAGDARQRYTGAMTYRWSTAADYNADWGSIHFRDGRVVKVEFLPD